MPLAKAGKEKYMAELAWRETSALVFLLTENLSDAFLPAVHVSGLRMVNIIDVVIIFSHCHLHPL